MDQEVSGSHVECPVKKRAFNSDPYSQMAKWRDYFIIIFFLTREIGQGERKDNMSTEMENRKKNAVYFLQCLDTPVSDTYALPSLVGHGSIYQHTLQQCGVCIGQVFQGVLTL